MFHIAPIEEKERQKEYIERCGGIYRPEAFAFSMKDCESGALMGASQFELEAGKGILCDLRSVPALDDWEAMFILGRATMSFIEKIGITDCFADKNAGDARILRMIGFKPQEEGELLYCDLTGMFDGHCSGKPIEKKDGV